MFDVFYIGARPSLPFAATPADTIEHARKQCKTRYFWIVNAYCDYSNWDWLWEPSPWQAHQRHAWASQWARDSGTYLIPAAGFTETNYRSDRTILRTRADNNWQVDNECIYDDFDFTWHPDPASPPYIYQFGTQWQKTGGPRYIVPGATEVKYESSVICKVVNVSNCWDITDAYTEGFDFTWHPDATEKPYIYQFGTQWQKTGGPRYVMPGATEVKYINSQFASANICLLGWDITDAYTDLFDFTWHPDATEKPYIYQFGTQWQKTGGPRYIMPGATEVKYVNDQTVVKWQTDSNWDTTNAYTEGFDFTWHPDATEKPYIYQFGTQWQKTSGPRYIVPGATEVKYIRDQVAIKTDIDPCWDTTDACTEGFDFTWHPDATEKPYIYQFGTQWQKTGGPRYIVPSATEVKYVRAQAAYKSTVDDNWDRSNAHINGFDFTWHPDATEKPYIYQFGTQWQKTGGPRYIVLGATEVKYVSSPRAIKQVVDDNWQAWQQEIEQFDFTWHPDATEKPYIYQFGTQWQKTGGPRYVVPGATEVKYITQSAAKVAATLSSTVVLISHNDANVQKVKQQLEQKFANVKVVRYVDSYLLTLRRIAQTSDAECLWICSSLCDYSKFDFTWHPEQWQAELLHVFASDDQAFGDTFFMHVPTFKQQAAECELLEWYNNHFVEGISVPRWPLPVVEHSDDSHVDAIKQHNFAGPLALFKTACSTAPKVPAVPLWRQEVKTVLPLTVGSTAVVVPSVAVPYIKQQVYDYPHVDFSVCNSTAAPLDIVFISNGEPAADQLYEHLCAVVKAGGYRNRIVRSDSVTGRVAAYRAAATASTTAWFFAVFAKLYVSDSFDWDWQPDRLQQPKHYIFHAHNPVTGLEYGHMAAIAYNRQLVLDNSATGLDFTLDQLHEVVPVLSGVAQYCDSDIVAWRTAFRECIKLQHSMPDVEAEYRLHAWLHNNKLGNAAGEWSKKGAADAVEFYHACSGEFEQLRKSYDWAWLNDYFKRRKKADT